MANRLSTGAEDLFSRIVNEMSDAARTNAKEHGWGGEERNDGEMIALIHSEVSELLKALRADNPQSDKIPEFSNAEEEAADIVIRMMEMCALRGWDLGGAIIAKHKFNISRPHKHGGKRF
jgi:NTP pyrophosphatase (non-canonical NTP hydrolase)